MSSMPLALQLMRKLGWLGNFLEGLDGVFVEIVAVRRVFGVIDGDDEARARLLRSSSVTSESDALVAEHVEEVLLVGGRNVVASGTDAAVANAVVVLLVLQHFT